MDSQGKIRGFGQYPPHHLEQMKKDLDISMSIPQITYCASYYRAQEKRDPAIDEFKMLDRFVSFAGAFSAPVELLTNNSFAAQTFADLMQKRRLVNPDAKYPCTLSEILSMADSALEHAGKPKSLPSHLFLTEETAHSPFAGAESNCIGLPDANFRLRILPGKLEKSETGDLLVLLRPRETEGALEHGTAVGALLNDPDITSRIKRLCNVSQSGLLHTLLTISEGLWIDLSRLSVTGEPVPLSMLVNSYAGDLLVQIGQKEYEKFYQKAKQHRLRAQAFAALTNGSRFTIRREHGTEPFSLESGFLRSLIPMRMLSVELCNEAPAPNAPILHTPTRGSSCAYLQEDIQKASAEAIAQQDVLCAAAYCAPHDQIFRNILDTLLTPILTLAAAGGDYAKQRLALGVTLPKELSDSQTAGRAVSALLAIYRLQCELGIPSASTKMTRDPSRTSPALTAFAMAEDIAPLPTSFTAAGNRIYCLAPEAAADGLPSFRSLRKMLDYLTSLCRAGSLKSAHVLCRESVTSGLRSMKADGLGCQMTGMEWAFDGEIGLAILIETDCKIEAKQIGLVIQTEAKPKKTTRDLPAAHDLIWSENPRITLVCTGSDRAAHTLAKKLKDMGADVSLLSDTPEDTLRLSQSLLTSQTLILCGKARLNAEPHLDFATDTFLRAGGRTLLLGGAQAPYADRTYAFPSGLSPENLEQICQTKR